MPDTFTQRNNLKEKLIKNEDILDNMERALAVQFNKKGLQYNFYDKQFYPTMSMEFIKKDSVMQKVGNRIQKLFAAPDLQLMPKMGDDEPLRFTPQRYASEQTEANNINI